MFEYESLNNNKILAKLFTWRDRNTSSNMNHVPKVKRPPPPRKIKQFQKTHLPIQEYD